MIRKVDIREWRSARHAFLRNLNEILVLNIIRERQPLSRIEIAQISGLEPGTVTRILQRFLAIGMIREVATGAAGPAGGRRPRYITLNPFNYCVIGLEIGVHETLLALSDFDGRIQDFRRLPTTRDPHSTVASVVDELHSLMRRVDDYDQFGGIGVGLIGLLDTAEGAILEGENLGWPEPVQIGKMLRERLPDVPFYFENSARLCALGEIWFGSPRFSGVRHLVFLQVDEGIGSGIIIDGQLYKGHRNMAGEFGHVCIDPAGPPCSCGSRGCLEAFASNTATVQRYLKSVGAKDSSEADFRVILELAKRGDAHATAALRQTARYLGLGLAPIIYGVGPEVIVLGGAIAEAWPLLVDEIWKACAERVSQPFIKNTRLEPSTLEGRAGLYGAISLVLARNFACPELFPVA